MSVTLLGQSRIDKPALSVSIVSITRSAPGFVEIRYELKNQGLADLYIPCTQVPGAEYMTTLTLLHRTNGGAWVSLGPYYDVPSTTAKILKPGEAFDSVDKVHDPAEAIVSDTKTQRHRVSIALRGVHKLKIRYYSGSADWERWLKEAKGEKSHEGVSGMPHLIAAYSVEFDLTPPAK